VSQHLFHFCESARCRWERQSHHIAATLPKPALKQEIDQESVGSTELLGCLSPNTLSPKTTSRRSAFPTAPQDASPFRHVRSKRPKRLKGISFVLQLCIRASTVSDVCHRAEHSTVVRCTSEAFVRSNPAQATTLPPDRPCTRT